MLNMTFAWIRFCYSISFFSRITDDSLGSEKNWWNYLILQALLNLSVDPFVGVADLAKKIVNSITLKVGLYYKH